MKLNPLVSNGMILQGGKPACISGEGEGEITAVLGGQTVKTACVNGEWCVTFSPLTYGDTLTLTVSDGKETVTVSDILVGDVYLCAGQSNMKFMIREEELPAPTRTDDGLRVFYAGSMEKYEGLHIEDGWVKCRPDNAGYWSAIGYHVGEIQREKNGHPVGIICCSQGASTIQSWIGKDFLTKDVYVPFDKRHMDSTYPDYAGWNKDGILYDTVFSGLMPATVSAVIWYQGESNTSAGEVPVYGELFSRLVKCWRRDLHDDTTPFVTVVICDLDDRAGDPDWIGIQKVQREAPKHLSRVYAVESADICAHYTIHPPVKLPLAERIAALL